jgi:hypothetical protein
MNNNTLLFHYSSDFIILQKKEGAELLMNTHPALFSAPVPACSRGHEKEWIHIIVSLPNPIFDIVNCYWVLFPFSFFSLLLYAFARFSWLSIRNLLS